MSRVQLLGGLGLQKYQRGAVFSIAATPFMTVALWALSRQTARPMSFREAFGGAVAIAIGLIF